MRRDVTLDESEAARFGRWDYYLPDICTGPGAADGVPPGQPHAARARFQPHLPWEGRYLVCIGFRPAKDQATNTALLIHHAGGNARVTLDQRTAGSPLVFAAAGEFRFRGGDDSFVDIGNSGADGRVAIDAVRWVWVGD